MIFRYLWTFVEDFKAWRRGQRRTAPRTVNGVVTRGRTHGAATQPLASVRIVHTRAADGHQTVYEYTLKVKR